MAIYLLSILTLWQHIVDIDIDDEIDHSDEDSPSGRHSEIQNTAITRIVHPHLMTIMITTRSLGALRAPTSR